MKRFKEENVYIYLVDDNELFLKVLETKFKNSTNYFVQTFNTGEAFLDNILSYPPAKKTVSIAIIDYNLTTLENVDAKNGLKILKTSKEINKDIEFIMLSAEQNPDVANTAIDYGAKTFIEKNDNSFVRLQNNIKWIISQRILDVRKKHSKCSQKLFITAILAVLVFVSIFYFKEFFK